VKVARAQAQVVAASDCALLSRISTTSQPASFWRAPIEKREKEEEPESSKNGCGPGHSPQVLYEFLL
jgi:hypothetical protein